MEQLRRDVIELGTDPSMEWEMDRMIGVAKEKPAKFFKDEEHADKLFGILERMQADGKLSELA